MKQPIDLEGIRAVYKAACHALAEKDHTHEAMTCIGSAVGQTPTLLDEVERLQGLLGRAVEDITICCDTCNLNILETHCHELVNGDCVNWYWRGFGEREGVDGT